MVALSSHTIKQFRALVYGHYARYGRDLPWRRTHAPYKIVVSEIMLQQTQVSRVVAKYGEFLRAFPTIKSLAAAPLRKVLSVWQGLGYNRRALSLQNLARAVRSEYKGKIPSDRGKLRLLPGIGEATSGAICAFAFNRPEVFIETNIRSVFLRYFFPGRQDIGDTQLLPYLIRTLDRRNPRKWYNALMDYGVYLKETFPNPSRKSLHYRKQSTFQGSNRQLRGAILRVLLKSRGMHMPLLYARLPYAQGRIKAMVRSLICDGLLKEERGRLRIR